MQMYCIPTHHSTRKLKYTIQIRHTTHTHTYTIHYIARPYICRLYAREKYTNYELRCLALYYIMQHLRVPVQCTQCTRWHIVIGDHTYTHKFTFVLIPFIKDTNNNIRNDVNATCHTLMWVVCVCVRECVLTEYVKGTINALLAASLSFTLS